MYKDLKAFATTTKKFIYLEKKMKKTAKLTIRLTPELKDTIEKFMADFKIKNYGTFIELVTQITLKNTKELEKLISNEKKELKSIQHRIKYLRNKYKFKGEKNENLERST